MGDFENKRVLRIGVLGFHSEIMIAMNFFEMSYYEDYEVSKRKALKAIDQLQVRGQNLVHVLKFISLNNICKFNF